MNRGAEASEPLKRGKKSIALDLKQTEGVDILKRLCKSADVLIEPFRPGVMEKLGIGPKDLSVLNKRLIFARLSGFGQTGPMSKRAGHDINYLAVSGLLSLLGNAEPAKPNPPINILADFAGGGLMCALGVCIALLERQNSGLGQVIDANLVEGTSYAASSIWATRDTNRVVSQLVWPNIKERGRNLLDGGAPFYNVFRTKDNKYMAVGSLEPQFFANLIKGLGLKIEDYPQEDMDKWEKHKDAFQTVFFTKTQQEWNSIFDPLDCCITPVVEFEDAPLTEQSKARNSFLLSNTPRPAPYLERTPGMPSEVEPRFGQHTEEILLELGFQPQQLADYVKKGTIAVDEELGLQSKL